MKFNARALVLSAAAFGVAMAGGCEQETAKPKAQPVSAPSAEQPADAMVDTKAEPARIAAPERPTVDLGGTAGSGRQAQGTPRPPATGDGAPDIAFETPAHDFGVTYDESKLEHTFEFRNTGNAALTVGRVTTSCGCTGATVGKSTIMPGETGQLHVTFKPKPVAGQQTKQVTVFSNDPDSPQTVLSISARMIQAVEMQNLLRLGTVMRGDENHVVRLDLYARDKNFKLKSIKFDKDQFITYREVEGAKPPKIDPETPGYKLIEFVIDKAAPTGTFSRQMDVVLDAAPEPGSAQREQRYNVRLFGQIQGDLVLNPTFMRVPPTTTGGEWQASTILYLRSGRDFEVSSAELIGPVPAVRDIDISYEKFTYQGKPAYKVTVSGTAGPKATAYRGDIRVKTNLKDEPEMKLVFNGQVRNPRP